MLFLALAARMALGLQAPVRDSVVVGEIRALPTAVLELLRRELNAPQTLLASGAMHLDAAADVAGTLAVLEGRLRVAGHVRGWVIGVGTEVVVDSGARVDSGVVVLGGRWERRGGEIQGEIRVYGDPIEVLRRDGLLVVQSAGLEEAGWLREGLRRGVASGRLRVVSARTYNRVEGLPVLLGPSWERHLGWGRAWLEALGIWRSVDGFEWSSSNLGHTARVGLAAGSVLRLSLEGRLFDAVAAVEPWQLGDAEAGLAAFFLRRDYRDYFDKHGAALAVGLELRRGSELSLSYSHERWAPRLARNPFTLFRRNQSWRPNPLLDGGTFHLATLTLVSDTRNDSKAPWSGWLVTFEYEYARGRISLYGASSPLVRRENPLGRAVYDRLFLDVRRYSRVSAEGQFNLRLLVGGWLSGDELPLQRRFSLGGPATLPGFDFRQPRGPRDVLTCSISEGYTEYPPGVPGQCERVALLQLEYRGDVRLDPLGLFDEERVRRRRGWGRGAEWVLFVDAGRGWLVGPRLGNLFYGSRSIPPFSTWQADVGAGIRLDDLGFYVAKAISEKGVPLNFFVRLAPRF
jgi:hypothetical protein